MIVPPSQAHSVYLGAYREFPILPGYYFESNSYFKTRYFKPRYSKHDTKQVLAKSNVAL